jgi:hypothetical protein
LAGLKLGKLLFDLGAELLRGHDKGALRGKYVPHPLSGCAKQRAIVGAESEELFWPRAA